jgi:hypothetical protein
MECVVVSRSSVEIFSEAELDCVLDAFRENIAIDCSAARQTLLTLVTKVISVFFYFFLTSYYK